MSLKVLNMMIVLKLSLKVFQKKGKRKLNPMKK